MTDTANVELEVKLTADASAMASASAILALQSQGPLASPLNLRNLYFDTPDLSVNSQRMALRVRQKGTRFVQTLKTQGEFVDGGHRRMEWEWLLETTALDLSLLAETPLADHVDLHQLQPVFETNFERQIVMVTEPGAASAEGETLVEVAIDQGRILSGSRAMALCEIEFELKSGAPVVLRAMAVKLANAVPVFLNVISKAEQGYHLAGVASPGLEITAAPDVYSFFRLLSACWLRQLPFPANEVDFTQVRKAASAAGVSADFETLVGQLASGCPVNALIEDGLLGRVQLAVAGV
jgi:inorganic triphosphatase YgiF